MSILGNRVTRREDPALLRGESQFVDDVKPEGAAYVTYVRSTMAYARLTEIDVAEAKSAPGVLAIVTAADIEYGERPAAHPLLNQDMGRPILAGDIVRFVGEPILAIVTEHEYQAQDAAELVFIDYDPLDAVIDPRESLKNETILHEAAGTNIAFHLDTGENMPDFDSCDVVIEQAMTNQRLAPAPLECRTAACEWKDGRLIQYCSGQGSYDVRDALAGFYELEPGEVRVISKDVGGSFGSKSGAYPEELLLGDLSRRVGRPVFWAESRSESMTNLAHGRAQLQTAKMGGMNDGTITAYQLDIVQDAGAYPAFGALLPFMTMHMLSAVYTVQDVRMNADSAMTNTNPVAAYRGAGRPEAAAAFERALDMFAAEIGMDPAEVRYKNFIDKDAFPYTTPTGTTYDVGNYAGALDLVLEKSDYKALRAEQAERRASGDAKQIGIGLSAYVEVTAFGGGTSYGSVELRNDGTVLGRTGSSPYGQGHHTAWAMLVSERMGIDMEKIEIIHGDTDLVPKGEFTGGSRSLQLSGSSMDNAAAQVVELAKQKAADRLEAAVEDVVLDKIDGKFHVQGSPTASVTWDELAAEQDENDILSAISDFKADSATYPFGAHLVVVEVDTETGGVELKRIIACDDAGTILNPLLVEGQVHGGLAQGIAQAIFEEVQFDEWGTPLTSNLGDYTVPSATEMPMFERIPMETPTHVNPLGAKGIGESGTIGSTPAVHNAVVDAVAHLGVSHIQMPTTPQRIWNAIQEAKA